LQHPHIVPLIATGEAGGSLYYTMPFVEGESLRERMSRERPMSIESVTRTLVEVAGALEYAHEQGIVHRDIKPENVMFFHDSAVVLDFGISKAVSAAVTDTGEHAPRITQSGMSLGTPIYVSPEQAQGDPDLDHRADIYSLGVVAYEMLCGHPPFSGRTPQLIFAAHAQQDPDPITDRRPDVPAPLAKLVMRCLEKAPAKRPQTAGDIVQILRGTPAGGFAVVGAKAALARIPAWVPWVVAGVSTLVAVWLAIRLAAAN
jgi:serine/threonine-protein kinase